MKQLKPTVVRDFRGQDYVQTSNVCGNTTYVRNYQVEYLLSLAPEHVNKLLTSLSENGKLDRYLHREQKHHIYMCLQYYLVWPINGSQMCDVWRRLWNGYHTPLFSRITTSPTYKSALCHLRAVRVSGL